MWGKPYSWLRLAGILPALILGCLGAETADSHPTGWLLLALSVVYLSAAPLSQSVIDGIKALRTAGHRWLWLAMSGSVGVCLVAPIEHLGGTEFLAANEYLEPLGALCTMGGAALGAWTHRIRRRVEAVVVSSGLPTWPQSGPYHILRYPGFAALLMLALGLALSYSSPAALALAACLILPAVVLHIVGNERCMLVLFGAAYRGYTQRTARLLPGVW